MSPPRPLAAVVQRAQATRPDDRYDSVESLQADVRRYLDGLAVSAYAEPAAERFTRVVDPLPRADRPGGRLHGDAPGADPLEPVSAVQTAVNDGE